MLRGFRYSSVLALAWALQAQSGAQSPLTFDANNGQTDVRVKFLAHTDGGGVFVADSEVVWSLAEPEGDRAAALRMRLENANRGAKVEGLDLIPGRSNYFLGNDPRQWRSQVPRYARVEYRGVYPGIDLMLHGSRQRLEYDFVVSPGADPRAIRLVFEGAMKMSIDASGDLVISTAAGEIQEHKPLVYQQAGGTRKEIPGRYTLAGKRAGFAVGEYDRNLPLVIDPVVTYATYLGGSDLDIGQGIAHDAAGNIYVTGYTASSNFPTTAGAYRKTLAGAQDAFITKLNPQTGWVYSTYIGGSAFDRAKSIAVDAAGNAYITGFTNSTDFPATPGALQTTGGGTCGANPCIHAFVAKLNAAGSGLVYSTYLASAPGTGGEIGVKLAIDAAGNAYVTGSTNSAQFPTTAGAFSRTFGGGSCGAGTCDDAYVVKLNASGTALVYATYLGGSNEDFAEGIAIDGTGNAYVTGGTSSANFPATAGVVQSALKPGNCSGAPCADAFIAKLNPSGSSLMYATFLGGGAADNGQNIALDGSGNAYVIGTTGSPDFPVTVGAFQKTYGGGQFDIFVAAINPSGTALVASTFLGGNAADTGSSIKIGEAGEILVVGDTASTNFPATPASRRPRGAPQAVKLLQTRGILGHFDPELSNFDEDDEDEDEGSHADADEHHGSRCVTGAAGPTEKLPTGPSSAQPAPGGNIDAKVVCVAENAPPPQKPPTVSNSPVGTAADPISTASGELFAPMTPDLSLGGPLPLQFVRYYASLLGANGIQSALGNNWRHNFDWTLAATATSATVTEPNGKAIDFIAPSSGSVWLLKNPDQYEYQLTATSDGTHRFFDPEARRIYSFSAAGALTKIEDLNGNALTVTAGSNGPASVADGLGRTLTFTYTSGQLTKVADQTGRAVNFTYASQNLATSEDASGKVTAYSYTSQGSITGLMAAAAEPAGNLPYKQTFNSAGQVTSQTDSNGHTTTLAFDAATNTATITDPLGRVTEHVSPGYIQISKAVDANNQAVNMTYDTGNHRVSITDRLGAATTLGYDASGYLNSLTDALGNTTKAVYTAQIRQGFQVADRTQVTYADGTTASATYDANGKLTKLVDPAGKILTYIYDSHGQVLTATNPSGGTAKFTYNTDGTVATLQTPAGDAYAFSFDGQKRVSKIGYPDGSSRTLAYDNLDNLVKTTDERGQSVNYSYDINGRWSGITDPAGTTKSFVYDGNDRLIQSTDRLGKTRKYQYNELGLLKSVTNEAGETYAIGYDKLNRVSSVLDPAGKGSTLGYTAEGVLSSVTDALNRTVQHTSDAMGRVTGIKSPLGENSTITYDKLGRPSQITDPLSHTASYTYDARGLLSGVVFPAGVSASFTYGDLRRMTSIKDGAGNTWRQTFDKAGRAASNTDPLGRTTTYTYGARSRLSGFSTPVGSASFTYDQSGNMTEIKYSDGLDLHFTADSQNRITSANSVSLSYDAEGRITNSNGLAIGRDAAGRITGVTVASGKKISYAYNTRGLLSSVSDWNSGVTTFTYDDAGQLVTITRPNGIVSSYAYDGDGRVAGIMETKPGQQALSSVALQRDAAGHVTSAVRTNPQPASPVAGSLALSYDAADQVSGSTYDGLGRRMKDALRTYTWDGSSRLKGYSGADGTATFTYDGFGNRISSVSGNTTRNYVVNYAFRWPSISVVRNASGDLRYYVHLPGGWLLYSIEAADNSRHFFHFDEMGSTVFLSDGSGAVVQSYGVTPYGETVRQNGSLENPFTFMGSYGVMQEGTTGLYYMRAREYDSTTASFLSADPLRSLDPRAVNPYQYALANPLTHGDPSGLQAVPPGDFRVYPNGVGWWDGDVATYTPKKDLRDLPKKLKKKINQFEEFVNEQVLPVLDALNPAATAVFGPSEKIQILPHPHYGGGTPQTSDQQQVQQGAAPQLGGTLAPGGQNTSTDTKIILPKTQTAEKWFKKNQFQRENPEKFFLPYPTQAEVEARKQQLETVVKNSNFFNTPTTDLFPEDSDFFRIFLIMLIGDADFGGGMATVDPPNFQEDDGPPRPPDVSILSDILPELKKVIVIN